MNTNSNSKFTTPPVDKVIFPPPYPPDGGGWRPRNRIAPGLAYRISTSAIGPRMRFGWWVTIGEPRKDCLSVRWILARCQCGTIKEVRCANLANGRSLSCGCFHRDRVSADASTAQHERWSGKVRDTAGNWITP